MLLISLLLVERIVHDYAAFSLRIEKSGLACFISHIFHLSSFYIVDKTIITKGQL